MYSMPCEFHLKALGVVSSHVSVTASMKIRQRYIERYRTQHTLGKACLICSPRIIKITCRTANLLPVRFMRDISIAFRWSSSNDEPRTCLKRTGVQWIARTELFRRFMRKHGVRKNKRTMVYGRRRRKVAGLDGSYLRFKRCSDMYHWRLQLSQALFHPINPSGQALQVLFRLRRRLQKAGGTMSNIGSSSPSGPA